MDNVGIIHNMDFGKDAETAGITGDGRDTSTPSTSSPIDRPVNTGLSNVGMSAMSGESPVPATTPPDVIPTFKVDLEAAKMPRVALEEPKDESEERILLPLKRFATPVLTEAAKRAPGEVLTYGQMKEVVWSDGSSFVEAFSAVQKNAMNTQLLVMGGSTVMSPSVVLPEHVRNSTPDGVFTDIVNITGNFSLPSENDTLDLDTVAWAQSEISKHIRPEHFTVAKAATFLVKINDQPWGIVGTGVNVQANQSIEYGIFAAGNILTAKSGVGFKQIVS